MFHKISILDFLGKSTDELRISRFHYILPLLLVSYQAPVQGCCDGSKDIQPTKDRKSSQEIANLLISPFSYVIPYVS